MQCAQSSPLNHCLCSARYDRLSARYDRLSNYAFSANYHACIAMPKWPRCAPPILFDIDPHLPIPKLMYKLDVLRRFSLMGTTSCAVPNNLYAISRNYHVDIAMSTWHTCTSTPILFDLHTLLLLSRAATCPTSNFGRGTSLFRQELVHK